MVFHNAKFDMQKLIRAGLLDRSKIKPENFDNTETLAHLVNNHWKLRLKGLAKQLLGMANDEEQALAAARRQTKHPTENRKLRKSDGYHLLPREVVVPYAAADAEMTILLYAFLAGVLPKELVDFYLFEKEGELAFLDMEAGGFQVDLDYCEEQAKSLRGQQLRLELSMRRLVGIEDFNPRSNPQIKEAFTKRGMERESYNKQSLATMADDRLAALLIEYRDINKKIEYFEAILEEQENGVLHPNFRYNGTSTGRTSSGTAEGD